jgi:hypothetical protein
LKKIPFRQFVPGISWFILVLVLICLPKSDVPDLHGWFHLIHGDKWVHAAMFGIMALLFFWPFHRSTTFSQNQKQNNYLWIAILTIFWGYLTECIQRYIPGRSYDLIDWAADSAGVVLVFIFMRLRHAD